MNRHPVNGFFSFFFFFFHLKIVNVCCLLLLWLCYVSDGARRADIQFGIAKLTTKKDEVLLFCVSIVSHCERFGGRSFSISALDSTETEKAEMLTQRLFEMELDSKF